MKSIFQGPILRIASNSPVFSLETALNAIYGSKRVKVCNSERYKTAGCVAEVYITFSETDKEGMRLDGTESAQHSQIVP